MDLSSFGVRATAGTLRASEGVVLPHAWTTYREAERLGIEVDGVAVEADGGFDGEWRSTGIVYSVVLDSPASAEELSGLRAGVDELAEIPRAVRAGAPVQAV